MVDKLLPQKLNQIILEGQLPTKTGKTTLDLYIHQLAMQRLKGIHTEEGYLSLKEIEAKHTSFYETYYKTFGGRLQRLLSTIANAWNKKGWHSDYTLQKKAIRAEILPREEYRTKLTVFKAAMAEQMNKQALAPKPVPTVVSLPLTPPTPPAPWSTRFMNAIFTYLSPLPPTGYTLPVIATEEEETEPIARLVPIPHGDTPSEPEGIEIISKALLEEKNNIVSLATVMYLRRLFSKVHVTHVVQTAHGQFQIALERPIKTTLAGATLSFAPLVELSIRYVKDDLVLSVNGLKVKFDYFPAFNAPEVTVHASGEEVSETTFSTTALKLTRTTPFFEALKILESLTWSSS